MTEQSKIVVTGATGNVGGRIVAQLVDEGADVRGLTRNPDTGDLPERFAGWCRGNAKRPPSVNKPRLAK